MDLRIGILLCRHIPDRFEHLVRYVGWYSNRSRGKRARADAEQPATPMVEDTEADAARATSTWARLIYKVYEVDPLECPRCKGPMCVIALIEDPEVIRKILEPLRRWAPRQGPQRERASPEAGRSAEGSEQLIRILTYHPVPDIA